MRWCRRSAPRRPRRKRLGFVYVPNGMWPPNFHPEGNGGAGLSDHPGAALGRIAARTYGGGQRVEQHAGARQRSGRRRAHAQPLRLAERRAAEADRGSEHHQRQDRGSVRGRRARRRHVAALARAHARVELPGGQLRSRLQLRVPELDVVARPELAAAARVGSARRLSAAVRRRRHGVGAPGADAEGPQHPRFGDGERRRAEEAARRRRSRR